MKHILYAAVMAAFSSVLFLSASQPVSARASINIVASNWKFTPQAITVKVDQPVTFRLTSASGIHGLGSPELGIPNTIIMPAKAVNVTFTPKKKGTYLLHCTIFCGQAHANMTIAVKVV